MSEATNPRTSPVGRAAVLLSAAALVLGGAVSLWITTLPYETVKGWVDSLSNDGRVDWFTPEELARRASTLRVFGASLLVAAVLLLAFRRRVARAVHTLSHETVDFTAGVLRRHLHWLRTESRLHLAVLAAVVAWAVVTRLWFLSQPIRYDEAFTFINYMSRPWLVAISDYSWPNNHVFHSLVGRISVLLFGDELWAIRLPAFLAGVLVVPATYLLIRTFHSASAGLLAAGLVSASSPLILYSTNARGYTLITLFFLLIMVLAHHQVRVRHTGGWLWFVLLGAVGALTLPVMLYPFGIAVTWMALSLLFERERHERPLLRPMVLACVAVGVLALLLYLPAIVNTGIDRIIANESVRTRPWATYLAELPGALRDIWSAWNVDHGSLLTGALLTGFLVSVLFHPRLARDRVPLVAAVVAWTVSLSLLNRGIPFVRVWLFLVPVYLGLAAVGLDFVIRSCLGLAQVAREDHGPDHPETRILGAAAIPVVTLVLAVWVGLAVRSSRSVYLSDETGTLRDAEEIALLVQENVLPGDRVIARIPSESPLVYYMGRLGLPAGIVEESLSTAPNVYAVVNEEWGETLDDVLRLMEHEGREVTEVRLLRRFPSASFYRLYGPPPEGSSER